MIFFQNDGSCNKGKEDGLNPGVWDEARIFCQWLILDFLFWSMFPNFMSWDPRKILKIYIWNVATALGKII